MPKKHLSIGGGGGRGGDYGCRGRVGGGLVATETPTSNARSQAEGLWVAARTPRNRAILPPASKEHGAFGWSEGHVLERVSRQCAPSPCQMAAAT